MIHFYFDKKRKRWNCDEPTRLRILCTNEWVQIEDKLFMSIEERKKIAAMYTATMHNVTCKECLKTLIPKKEAQLKKMHDAFNQTTGVSL